MERQTAFSVSELLREVRSSVERATGQVWIKGEVSSLKTFGKGDWYFTLRDEESSVRCVMWKTYTYKLRTPPPDGTEVYALATPTVWEAKGELRLRVVTMLASAGIGSQQLGKERARQALERDGLLAPERKRRLPEFPSVIALVTSQDGAALQDMIIVARRRWPAVRLMLVAATVQGEEAPRSLCRALGLVNRLPGVDLCIVGRGGGAREDLLAFDDEQVCRAIAALRVPSISAVGHEVDLALADLVADLRAPTPSAAMELALPDRVACLRQVESLGKRLAHGLGRRTGVVAERLARSGDRLRSAMLRRVSDPRGRVERLAAQLEALSPLGVLARGYSVARLGDGRVARRRADLPRGTSFTLRVSDGDVASRAEA